MAGIGCAGYIQNMFLNGKMNDMNGDRQVWSNQTLFINICVWFVILLIVVIGGCHIAKFRKICKYLVAYLSIIQIVSLGWLVLTKDTKSINENAAITKNGALELASEKNVLVFVLDRFDSEWFEKICQEDESILKPLKDFTYYRNGTSQFAHTDLAIPYMLTAVEWDSDVEDYPVYAYEQSHVIEQISKQGVDVKIFTELNLLSEDLCQILENYTDNITRKYDFGKTFCTMLKTSMYKTAPFLLKCRYEYYTSDIKEMTYSDEIWSVDNDFLLYQDLITDGLSVSEKDQRAFRFYHMRGVHSPFYLTEDLQYESTGRGASLDSQGKGCLKIVYEYMEKMKELGKYEDALIIITADHGRANDPVSEKYQGRPDKVSRPIFLIKQSTEHHDHMEISEAPVSQAELMPTILDALDMEYASYGRTFEEIPTDEQRIRTYIDIFNNELFDNYHIEYVITGHAAELNNWSIEKAEYRR